MRPVQGQPDPRRAGFSGLSAISLFLAAVIVLTGTPAMLAESLSDSTHPIARMGSQLRRIAVPVRMVAKARKHQQHRPVTVSPGRAPTDPAMRGTVAVLIRFDGPAVAPLLVQFMDLPPPAPRPPRPPASPLARSV
jgi:hypothetical protein